MSARDDLRADSWDEGYRSGYSNAMRRMSDEPDAPTTPNPYREAEHPAPERDCNGNALGSPCGCVTAKDCPSAPEPPSGGECDGSFMCDATLHEHGCYADEAGFCNHPEDHEPPSGGGVTAEELAEVLLAARVTGCCVDCPYGHGDSRDQAVEIVDAILARFDVRRRA